MTTREEKRAARRALGDQIYHEMRRNRRLVLVAHEFGLTTGDAGRLYAAAQKRREQEAELHADLARAYRATLERKPQDRMFNFHLEHGLFDGTPAAKAQQAA